MTKLVRPKTEWKFIEDDDADDNIAIITYMYMLVHMHTPGAVIKYGPSPSTLSNFIHSLTKIRRDWRKFAFFANYDFLHDTGTIKVIHGSFQKRGKARRNSFVLLFCKRQITIYYIYIKSLLLLLEKIHICVQICMYILQNFQAKVPLTMFVSMYYVLYMFVWLYYSW